MFLNLILGPLGCNDICYPSTMAPAPSRLALSRSSALSRLGLKSVYNGPRAPGYVPPVHKSSGKSKGRSNERSPEERSPIRNPVLNLTKNEKKWMGVLSHVLDSIIAPEREKRRVMYGYHPYSKEWNSAQGYRWAVLYYIAPREWRDTYNRVKELGFPTEIGFMKNLPSVEMTEVWMTPTGYALLTAYIDIVVNGLNPTLVLQGLGFYVRYIWNWMKDAIPTSLC